MKNIEDLSWKCTIILCMIWIALSINLCMIWIELSINSIKNTINDGINESYMYVVFSTDDYNLNNDLQEFAVRGCEIESSRRALNEYNEGVYEIIFRCPASNYQVIT